MNAGTKDLIEHGRFLRNAAPREFEEFVKVFESYVDTVTYAMLTAVNKHDLLRAQGRSQQCVKVLQLLGEIKDG
jgi:branched-subunit amino acid transport protein